MKRPLLRGFRKLAVFSAFIIVVFYLSYSLFYKRSVKIDIHNLNRVYFTPASQIELATESQIKMMATAAPIVPEEDSASRKTVGSLISESDCPHAQAPCPEEKVPYFFREGSGSNPPLLCLQGKSVFEREKFIDGGLAVAVFKRTKDNESVEHVEYFDLRSLGDKPFLDFLIRPLDPLTVVFMASWGEGAFSKISVDTKEVLRSFGLTKSLESLEKGRRRDLLAVGQRGLKKGFALEPSEGFLGVLSGCLSIPLGAVGEVNFLKAHKAPIPEVELGQVVRDVAMGREEANCGRKEPCPGKTFPIYAYSGANKDDEPKLCVNGRYYIGRDLNRSGRGLNCLVLNATTRRILRVGHFDTYAEDSSTLEIFLEEMIHGEMIVVVSFDEASSRLSNMAKQMFYELGSGLIQNLKFRASWYLIGQKGINGFTAFEELNYASNTEWAKPVDASVCVPDVLDGRRVRPDQAVQKQNKPKRHFCQKFDGYNEFCDDLHIDDPLAPEPLYNRTMQNHDIFKVPILVVAGLSHNSLRLCLETLLRQPGIVPKNVLVAYDENYSESEALANLFGMSSLAIAASSRYSDQVAQALQQAWNFFAEAQELIVIEEDLMVTVDFLYFMAQMLPLLRAHEGLLAISCWNPNGFAHVSGLSTSVYLVEDFPGLGFMLKRKAYTELLEGKMKECCAGRAWDGWTLDSGSNDPNVLYYTLIPDLSRVYRRHAEGLGIMPQSVEDLFNRPRVYNTEPTPWISGTAKLASSSTYDSSLKGQIAHSKVLRVETFKDCLNEGSENQTLSKKGGGVTIPQLYPHYSSFLVYYNQKSSEDYATLRALCVCFGLYHSSGQKPRGLYKGVLRFSYDKTPGLLVGAETEFFAGESKNIPVVTL